MTSTDRTDRLILICALTLCGAIFVLDLVLSGGVAVLYAGVLWLASKARRLLWILWLAIFCSFLTGLGFLFSPFSTGHVCDPVLHRGLALAVLWLTVLLLREILHSLDVIGFTNKAIEEKSREIDDMRKAAQNMMQEARLAKEQARESEEQIRPIIEGAPTAMLLVDQQGRIELVNASAEKLFQYERDELLSMNVEQLVPQRFRGHHSAYRHGYHQMPKARPMGAGRDLYGLRKDGTEVRVEIGLSPIMIKKNLHILASVVDITQRIALQQQQTLEQRTIELQKQQKATLNILQDMKETRDKLLQSGKELQRSNQELEQFAYVASHDLQEPLRMVASYCQLLEKRYGQKLDDKARTYISYAVDGAKRMRVLIDDLLAYARAGRKEVEKKDVDLNLVLKDILHTIKNVVQDKKATIEVDQLPVVKANYTQMIQLFQNLITNALKFTQERPPLIKIRARPVEGYWQFEVSDNGMGIEEKYFEKIFVIFQTLSKDQYTGTGIGLALCKKIVENYNGTIWVRSQAGQGTTFYFTLPKSGDGHD